MNTAGEPQNTILRLLASERLAVLATHEAGQPYTSLVAVSPSDDLTYVLFPTMRSTHKYRNIAADGRVALLVDNRSAEKPDSADAMALTITGIAAEVEQEQRESLLQQYLARQPHMKAFATDPECAIVKVQVDRYRLVRRLQDVAELDMKPAHD